jgi:hypothetical protein
MDLGLGEDIEKVFQALLRHGRRYQTGRSVTTGVAGSQEVKPDGEVLDRAGQRRFQFKG